MRKELIRLREQHSFSTLNLLKQQGVIQIVILTGDNDGADKMIAAELAVTLPIYYRKIKWWETENVMPQLLQLQIWAL